MNDPDSVYRVTDQHVVREYKHLFEEMGLSAKLLAHRGTFQPDVLMDEILTQATNLACRRIS